MKIENLPLTGSDDRGFTAEYLHERSGNQLALFRKAGSISGRHYHKGISVTKDPEILILLHGTLRFSWKHIDDRDAQSETVTAPAKLEVPPYIWHELVAETDCVLLEMNSIAEHTADTFYLP
jgi:hypothetical protein